MGTRPSRRRYLAAIGAAALGGGLAGCQFVPGPTPTPPPTPPETPTAEPPNLLRHGIQFIRSVDLVADFGADPTGSEPIDDLLAMAATAGTLVVLPAGRYLLNETYNFEANTVGLLGIGDVRIVPSVGFHDLVFDTNEVDVDEILLENVDIDITHPQTSAGIRLLTRTKFHVQDLEYVGRGLTEFREQASAFLLAITDPDGLGTLRRVVAKEGARIDGYLNGNGRIAVWAGWEHKGTIRIEKCDFREFGNNACYTSRTPGKVQIVDSYFLNNNASSIRLGGKGSFAENCTVEIDLEKYTGPPLENISTGFNTRAIVVETGVQLDVPGIEPGAEIRNCRVIARNSPKSQSLVELSPQGQTMVLKDSVIVCDIDDTPAIRRARPGELPWRPSQQVPPKPHWITVENVTILGSASGGEAIRIEEGPESVFRNCRIEQSGAGRDGIRLVDSTDCLVDGGSITTARHPIRVEYGGLADDRCLLKLGSAPTLSSVETADAPLLYEHTTDTPTPCIVTAAQPFVNGLDRSVINIDDISDESPIRLYGNVLFEA
ncbi:hypothetical protein [Haladaptatus sp. DYSN1]|uniref:hypothetical protein n=1 Tax=unclassified Haladaptatus TaxID=2622732 RepID=UPI002404BF17|nr:hypothetical protein [Haladaptatus sp. DYSN1]